MTWLRRHALVVGVAVLGALSFALFSWAEFGYFCDQAGEHLHDWVYNAASNWQSELLFGILLLVILLKIEGAHGADREDT
jgi:hypothetical protein